MTMTAVEDKWKSIMTRLLCLLAMLDAACVHHPHLTPEDVGISHLLMMGQTYRRRPRIAALQGLSRMKKSALQDLARSLNIPEEEIEGKTTDQIRTVLYNHVPEGGGDLEDNPGGPRRSRHSGSREPRPRPDPRPPPRW